MTIRRKLEPKKLPDQLQITRPPDDSLERKQPIYLERRFWKLTDFLVLLTSGSLSEPLTTTTTLSTEINEI